MSSTFSFSTSKLPFLKRNVRKVNAALDFPSVAAAGTSTLTIAVPTAAIGDGVALSFTSAPPAGLVIVAWVSAAGVVSVRVNNVTAAAVDAPSLTFVATVVKV